MDLSEQRFPPQAGAERRSTVSEISPDSHGCMPAQEAVSDLSGEIMWPETHRDRERESGNNNGVGEMIYLSLSLSLSLSGKLLGRHRGGIELERWRE